MRRNCSIARWGMSKRARFLAMRSTRSGVRMLRCFSIRSFEVHRRTLLTGLLASPLLRAQQAIDRLLSIPDYESAAHGRVAPAAWDRIEGGAADEITLRWNRQAYQKIRLKPRVLEDVSKIDTRVEHVGLDLSFPIVLAPTAE